MQIADKHVVVTGGGNGIGRALCRRFAAEGARAIVVADLDGVVVTPRQSAAEVARLGEERRAKEDKTRERLARGELGLDFYGLRAKLAEWESKLAPLKAMPMVAFHNSWPYFARRFRLDFVGFIETKPGVPPSPAHLAGIIRTMQARGARIVVREPQEPERDVAFVARKAGASTVTLAASVGALPNTSDYIALFDTNVAALTAAAVVR